MKRRRKMVNPAGSKPKAPVRTLLRQEGKLVHGTRGKPTRGPRGNRH